MPDTIPPNAIDPDKVNQEVIASEVLAKLLPEFKKLTPAELAQLNLDIPAAVSTVLGVLPEIRALRPQIAAHMPTLDLTALDKLEDYALALNDAHASYLVSIQPSDELKSILEEATLLRETLLKDATALTHRGLLSAQSLGELKGPVGFKNLATDLNLLDKALRGNWAKIAGKSALTMSELDRATKLQQHLLRALGLREQSTPAVADASDLRQRAFTCFLKAYDNARRAVSFLRWEEGDVDNIAPSLYAGRGGSKRKADTTPGTNVPPVNTPATAATGAAVTPGSQGGAVTQSSQAPTAAAARTATANLEPNSDPFLS